MTRFFKETKTKGSVNLIRQKQDLDKVDALIIPGGESTAISRTLIRSGLFETIRNRISDDTLAIMGTCAGCVLLAKKINDNEDAKVTSLATMDIEVQRNAFGRQKKSCECILDFKGFTKPYGAVFIRAPVITKVWNDCEVLAKLDKKIVAARQHRFLALSFHPELTTDLRVHEYFLEMI